jgi:hypothetical protein
MIDLVWLAVLLPLLGFLANGWLAFRRPRATAADSPSSCCSSSRASEC